MSEALNFGFSEDQQAIRELAAKILKEQVTDKNLREIEAGDLWLHRAAWQAMAEAQLLGLALPETHGGGGLGLLELYILLEEIGRYIAPVPVLESLLGVALPIAEFGSEVQKSKWLPALASGKTIATVALQELLSQSGSDIAATASPDGNGWRLQGRKIAVPFASVADVFLVAAKHRNNIGLFLVERKSPGLTIEPTRITTEEVAANLDLAGVQVSAENLLGSFDRGADMLNWLMARYTVGLCALESGVAQQALQMTAKYSRERKQFGVAICSFQAVAQRAADAFIAVEALRMTFWQAAWKLAAGLDADKEILVAKYWAAEGGYFTVAAAQHIHGGMGFDRDYPLFRYYLLSRKIETTLGGATQSLAALGDVLAASDAIGDAM